MKPRLFFFSVLPVLNEGRPPPVAINKLRFLLVGIIPCKYSSDNFSNRKEKVPVFPPPAQGTRLLKLRDIKMSSQGPVAIITGAAQGIGLAITEGLMKEGYRVCLADVNTAKGQESVSELRKKYGSGRAIFAECNVTSRESFEATFKKTKQELGRVDVLVNNAGIVDEDHPDRTVAINLMGTIIGCELAFKYMGTSSGGNGGSVINVSSVLGFVPYPKAPVYAATKHAVIGLTRSYGDPTYLEKHGIIFAAMCPYYVVTPLLENAQLLEGDSQIKMLKPEFIAQGVVKLLNDKQNGSTMLGLPGKLQYIGLQDELKDIIV